jgi:ribosome-associated protein
MTASSSPVFNDPVYIYAKAALGKKASRLVILDVHGLSSITDMVLICSGQSNRQVTAIADHIKVDLKKQGIRPLSIEGLTEGHWVVMDYGHVIIHVFYEPIRIFYDIEGLWADAKRIKIPDMPTLPATHDRTESHNEEN